MDALFILFRIAVFIFSIYFLIQLPYEDLKFNLKFTNSSFKKMMYWLTYIGGYVWIFWFATYPTLFGGNYFDVDWPVISKDGIWFAHWCAGMMIITALHNEKIMLGIAMSSVMVYYVNLDAKAYFDVIGGNWGVLIIMAFIIVYVVLIFRRIKLYAYLQH